MNELNRHKKSDKVKWIATCVAFLFIFVTLAGVCMQIFGKGKAQPSEWFKKNEIEQTVPKEQENGGMVVTPENATDPVENSVCSSVHLMSTPLELSDEETEEFESVQILRASVYPVDADDKELLWTIAWIDESKTDDVTEYVIVVPSENDTFAALIKCKQAFGVQIIVTAMLKNMPEIKATCTLDYVKRCIGGYLNFNGFNVLSGKNEELVLGTGSQSGGMKTCDVSWGIDFLPRSYFFTHFYGTGTVLDSEYTVKLKWKFSDAWFNVNEQEKAAGRDYFVVQNSVVKGQWNDFKIENVGVSSRPLCNIRFGRYMGVFDSSKINDLDVMNSYLRTGSPGAIAKRDLLKTHCKNIGYLMELFVTVESEHTYWGHIIAVRINPDSMVVNATNVEMDNSSLKF